jgi:hypothetical protein
MFDVSLFPRCLIQVEGAIMRFRVLGYSGTGERRKELKDANYSETTDFELGDFSSL